MNYLFICLVAFTLLFSACSLKPVAKQKNLTYAADRNLQLDVYAPRHIHVPKKVLVFVHGGNWVNGKKSIYRFFGKGMARKGLVTVVVNYRLSPATDYEGMAHDVATAVAWTKEHIPSFGGNPDSIYLSGHSAGGQLAALVATDDRYFKKEGISNPLKGTVLIDAFGLDMYSYLSRSTNEKDTMYKRVFTNDPENWKKGSPAYHLHPQMPPFLMFTGSKTYPVIQVMNQEFYARVVKLQPATKYLITKGKRHAGMIFQFVNPRKKAYRHILDFMDVAL